MKRRLGLVLAAGLSLGLAPAPSSADVRPDDLARSYSDFGAALMAKAAKGRANVVISPLSVGLALDMVLPGAKAATRDELAKLLGHGAATDAEITAAARALIEVLTLRAEEPAAPPPAPVATVPPPPATPPADPRSTPPADSAATPPPAAADKPVEEPKAEVAESPASKPDEPPPPATVKPSGPEIAIANALFRKRGAVREDYRNLVREAFGAEVFDKLDLAAINAWTKEKTKGRIPEILSSLPPETAAVILNAVYFKGSWESPFIADNTKPAPFRLSVARSADVPMMRRTGDYAVIERPGFRALRMPYAGGALSMVVMLPDRPQDLAKAAAAMDGDTLSGLVLKLRDTRPVSVDLWLPRFKAETSLDLVRPLREMGLKTLLCPGRADLTGMLEAKALTGPACVDKVSHRVSIEVAEKGAEAAAATAVRVSVRALVIPRKPIEFKVDRPFLFAIADEKTGTILFLGRILDPRAKVS